MLSQMCKPPFNAIAWPSLSLGSYIYVDLVDLPWVYMAIGTHTFSNTVDTGLFYKKSPVLPKWWILFQNIVNHYGDLLVS